MAHGQDPWFVYQRTAGRITGRPANLKGWLLFIGTIVAIPALAAPTMGLLLRAGHPVLGAIALAGILLTGLFLLVRMILAKGKQIG
jgi:hypothetical protein